MALPLPMDRTLLIKYLKFLSETADGLMRKDVVEDYDIATLKRELQNFKIKMLGSIAVSSALEAAIRSLELKVNEEDVAGEKAGVIKLTMKLLFGGGAAWQEVERRQQQKAKQAIEDFRNEVSHISFALEI